MDYHVEYCQNSTITEAWSVITGSPGEVRDADAGALENTASKSLGNFQVQPSFVVVERKEEGNIVPSFWHKQLSYENGKYAVRLGHRYLSVHFIKKGADKYDTYDKSLAPQIGTWLDAYANTVSGREEPVLVERAGFGYVNAFRFPVADFDLSRYFKVSFGTGAESTANGVATLDIKFRLNYAEDTSVEVNIGVAPESPEPGHISVVTKVEADKPIDNECSFEEKDKILDYVRKAKEAAKSVFFDLATDETHKIMGAKYDSSPTQ